MEIRRTLAALLVATVPVLAACDDDEPVSTTGSITVNTTTSGDDPDADGYTISVDGSGATAVAATGSATVQNVQAGNRSVMLDGVADNCTVATNPASVTVTAGQTATADFTIDCVANIGSVSVITTTNGLGTDTNGYQFAIDDADTTAIGEADTVTVDSVAVGDRLLSIFDLDNGCMTAADADTATVTVAFADTVEHTFDVDCTVAPVGSADRVGALDAPPVHLWPMLEDEGRHSARGVATP